MTTLSFDKKNPFVLEGMDWPYNMKDKTSVLEEYIPSDVPQADREKSKNNKVITKKQCFRWLSL